MVKRILRSRATLLLGVCGIGCLLLFGSWFWRLDSWLSSILIEIGATLLLFVPLLIAGRGIESRLDEVRSGQRVAEKRQDELEEQQQRTSMQISELSDDIELARSELTLARKDLSDAVITRIGESRSRDADLFLKVEDAPSRRSLLDATERAIELGLITVSGARVLLVDPAVYARVTPDPSDPFRNEPPFGVALETRDGSLISHVPWNDGKDATEFLVSVAESLQTSGDYPGDDSFDGARLFHEFSVMFTMAHRRSTDSGDGVPLKRIIQLCPPQWAILEDGIICTDIGSPYFIETNRVYERDWESHMREKGWVDFESFYDALVTSRELEARRQRNAIVEPPF